MPRGSGWRPRRWRMAGSIPCRCTPTVSRWTSWTRHWRSCASGRTDSSKRWYWYERDDAGDTGPSRGEAAATRFPRNRLDRAAAAAGDCGRGRGRRGRHRGYASPSVLRELEAVAPEALRVASLDALLEQHLDGIVIATPSALHAEQSIRALQHGVPVFCQKPLARTAAETRRVIEAARGGRPAARGGPVVPLHAKRCEYCTRWSQAGELGDVYAVDLVFHNAYGPDKALVPRPGAGRRRLRHGSRGAPGGPGAVDARLPARYRREQPPLCQGRAAATGAAGGGRGLRGGVARAGHRRHGAAGVLVEPAGRPRRGDRGAASTAPTAGGAFRNVNGSFYDFTAEIYRGTSRHTLALPPDDWGGRAAVDWAGGSRPVSATTPGSNGQHRRGRGPGRDLSAAR